MSRSPLLNLSNRFGSNKEVTAAVDGYLTDLTESQFKYGIRETLDSQER